MADAIRQVNCTMDLACVCPPSTQGKISTAASGCVLGNCTIADASKAQKAAIEACSSYTSALHSPQETTTLAPASSTKASTAAMEEASLALVAFLVAALVF